MSARPTVPLSNLFPGFTSSTDPQTLLGIWEAEIDTLSEPSRELRRQIAEVRNAFEQAPILTPEDVIDLIERKKRLDVRAGKWLIIPLTADRHRVLTPVLTDDAHAAIAAAALLGTPDTLSRRLKRVLAEPGMYRWVYASFFGRALPDAETLAETCPLPTAGTYLVLYGGSPEVLDTVADELEALCAALPVADVMFRHLTPNSAPAFYSLGCGRGEQAGAEIPFPNPTIAAQLRAGLRRGA